MVVLGGVFLFVVVATKLSKDVLAVPLADPADQFLVSAPTANSTLVGTVNISFKLFDDEASLPEYEVALYQTDCETKVGTIFYNDYSIKSGNNVYTKAFNTDAALLDRPAVSDGAYCLRICTVLRDDVSTYSVCDLREIYLSEEVNTPPDITSTPSNTNYLVGQSFGYDVNATDPEGDVLVYSLVNAPEFLQINSSTGEITSKGELVQPGSFSFSVRATDPDGAYDSQALELIVVQEPTPVTPVVRIVNPEAGDIVVADIVNIVWEYEGINVVGIEVFYSQDLESWEKLATLEGAVNSYDWDIDELGNGEYYLKVVITDAEGFTYERVSEAFSIDNEQGEQIISSAAITEVKPEPDSDIENLEKIEAVFVPSDGANVKVDSLKVLLDDNDITSQCALGDGFRLVCTVTELIESGQHKIVVSFSDTNEQTAQKEWTFNVVEREEGIEDDGRDSGILNTSTALIILSICLIAGLLIAIPWFLYNLWRRNNEGGFENEPYDYSPVSDTEVDPRTDLSSSYYDASVDVGSSGNVDDFASTSGEGDFDEYAIGEGDIGGSSDFAGAEETSAVPVQPGVVDTKVQEQSAEEIDKQFTEEDIPDWLKGDDISDPVDTKGQEIDIETTEEKKEDLKGAQPYSDYGLAKKDE